MQRHDTRLAPGDAEQTLVLLLARLRREGRQQSGLDTQLVPSGLDAAYRVAGLVAQELGWSIGGWKIAAVKQDMQRALRTNAPIYGPIFEKFIQLSPATLNRRKLAGPIVEIELAAKLGGDLPPRARPYLQNELADAVESLHPAIEVPECRFAHDAAFPPLAAILADGSGSGSLVFGPAIPDWKILPIAMQEMVLRVNGVERRRGTVEAAIDHPLVPLTWLANELSRTGIGLKSGQWVSTGTVTGMLAARAGETHVADCGSLGQVQVTFVD